MKKILVVFTMAILVSNSALAVTTLMFKSNQGEVNKGEVHQSTVLMNTTATTEVQSLAIISKNGNQCRLSTVSSATAFHILEGIKQGLISKIYCVTDDAGAPNSLSTKSFHLMY